MRAREDLCALGEIYARSEGFMRARGDLCSLRRICARPRRFMLAREDYARHGEFMLVLRELCSSREYKTHNSRFNKASYCRMQQAINNV
jgi:hypothetical protein